MDYRPRKLSGLAITVFLLYTGFVIWTVLSHNPYLYSHFELKSKLSEASDWIHQPVPRREGLANWTSPLSYTADFQEGKDVREATWEEWSRGPINISDFQLQGWIYDEEFFYLYSKNKVIAIDNDGKVQWEFKALAENGELFRPDVDSKMLYFAQSKGAVTALDRKTGQVLWWNELNSDILQQPLFVQNDIWLLIKASKINKGQNQTFDVISIRRASGEVTQDKRSFDAKVVSNWQWSEGLEQLLVVSDARIYAYGKDMSAVWNQNLGASIPVTPTVVGSSIYVATKLGRFFRLDGKRKGKVDWEAEIEGMPSQPAVYIPLVNGLVVGTEDSTWHFFENKSGQRKWKTRVENSQPLKSAWPLRLSVKHYEELHLHWPHKGWTLWTPCGAESLCILHPEKGNVLVRQSVGGALESYPRFNRLMAAVVKRGNGLEMRQWAGPIEKKKLLKEKAAVEGKPAETPQ